MPSQNPEVLPSWPAGHIILDSEALILWALLQASGTDGGLWPKQIFYKTTTTSRVNNTISNDPDLAFPGVALASYLVKFRFWFEATTAAGFQTMWTVPAGTTSTNRDVIGPGSTAADTSANNISMRAGVHNYTTAVAYGTRNNTAAALIAEETSIVTLGATPGTVALQWGQVTTTGGSATSVLPGSRAEITRVA